MIWKVFYGASIGLVVFCLGVVAPRAPTLAGPENQQVTRAAFVAASSGARGSSRSSGGFSRGK